MYFTDRGIEELEDRRGGEQLSVERLATSLARDEAYDLDDV
jgi:hypothetical protein